MKKFDVFKRCLVITAKKDENKRTNWGKYKLFYALTTLFNPCFWSKVMFLMKQDMVLPYIEIPVTVRCTLNCQHCSNLMQYYSRDMQKDVEIEELSHNIENLFEFVDYILKVRLIGGEPFLYKNLLPMIEKLENSGKVDEINIVTNGTILPSNEFFESIKKKPVSGSISNYGKLSKNMDSLILKLTEYNIPFVVAEEHLTWLDFGKVKFYQRTSEEYIKQYKMCKVGCRSFLKGKIHICPRSSHGMDIGIINDVSSDYVDIFEEGMTKKLFKEKFKKLEQKEFIEACKYCKKGLDSCESVPAAIQMERMK